MEHTFKLFDFNIYNDKNIDSEENDTEETESRHFNRDKSTFVIQMFGINEEGKKAIVF